jgi:lantibiotic modifying enzyme
VFNKFLIVSGKGYYLKITEGSSQVSPYLSNGSAGLLLCLLEIRQVYNTELYDSLILKLVKTLKSSEIPQRGSIINGLAGIVIAIYKYKTIFKDTAVDSRIWELVDLIPYYLYKNDKLLYLIDDTFGDVSVKFKDGNKGIVKIISDLKKNNFFNQEENL